MRPEGGGREGGIKNEIRGRLSVDSKMGEALRVRGVMLKEGEGELKVREGGEGGYV